MLKTYKVWITVYDDRSQTSFSSGADIDTLMTAQNYQQIEKMVEAQYNGCAKLRSAVEVR
jgi:hypothetical protein